MIGDKNLLARFMTKADLAAWSANWSDDERQAFSRVAHILHDAGLDGYHVNIGREVRCGRKKRAATDATETLLTISNLKPTVWVRQGADSSALGPPHDKATSLGALADALEAAPNALHRFGGGTAYWPDELVLDSGRSSQVRSNAKSGLITGSLERPLADGRIRSNASCVTAFGRSAHPQRQKPHRFGPCQRANASRSRRPLFRSTTCPLTGAATPSRSCASRRAVITANPGGGERVQVEWGPALSARDWYFYTYRATIGQAAQGNDMADRPIAFTFPDQPQDLGWFRNSTGWAEQFGDYAGASSKRF